MNKCIQHLKNVFDDSLSAFSSERSYSVLLEAKQSYFEQTGQVLEEDDDYEARMSSFKFLVSARVSSPFMAWDSDGAIH